MANKEIQPDFFESTDSSLGIYLREIGQIPLLTVEQEVELAKRIEAGRKARTLLDKGGVRGRRREGLEAAVLKSEEARKTLTKHNLKLAFSIAKKYLGTGQSLLDLIQDGNEGLMKAVDRFDWRRKVKFSTYATWWIRQAISRGVEKEQGPISIPSHMHQVLRGLEREASRLAQENGASVDIYDLAKKRDRQKPPGVPPATTRAVVARNVFSLDVNITGVDGQEADTPLIEFVQGEEDPVKDAEEKLLGEEVGFVLGGLPPRERHVVESRYGLDGEEGKTLQEVGEGLRVTRERVRQIQGRAMRRLRHPSRARKLGGFVDR